MAARLPLLHKTPFLWDPRPLREATRPHAGLLSVARAYRAWGLPDLIAANLDLRKRQRGFSEAQFIESISLLQALGGECPEDMALLAGDACLERGWGYGPPKTTAVREFLERFHDKDLEKRRPPREEQKSFIFPSSEPVAALQEVQRGLVRRMAKHYEKQGQPQRIATVDQDATILESHQQAADGHYDDGRGDPPMVAVWAELDWVLADEFRDGNVPAKQDPLTGAKRAFAAEVDFVPGEKSERKDRKPRRYVGLRLLQAQGVLFADGSDRHFHAVITHQTYDGGRLLEWHREKAGTVEHMHDEVKNGLGGKHVPSQRFGVNSAWFKIALLTYNIVSAIKGLCWEGEERTARLKRFRLLLIEVAGRMNRNNCVMSLRLCHHAAVLKRMQQVWQVFELPTQATAAQALGGRGG
jgi:hypothetical protein